MGGGLYGVAWSGAGYAAVGDGGVVLTSVDGVAWTRGLAGTGQVLNAVTWTGDRFVAVGASGTLAESADGADWTVIDSGTVNSLYGVAFVGGRLLALGNAGTILRANCSIGDALVATGPSTGRGTVSVSPRH